VSWELIYTELAQVLTRNPVKLAVFNACWGAQPDQEGYQAIPRSSLAEVLLHHGVPAVLALSPGAQLKFGATQNAVLEFVVEGVE
jgi:hypothetical protein